MTLEAKYRKPYCLPETIESNREILLHRLNNPPVTEDYKFVNFTREVLGFLRGNKEETFSIWLPRQDPGLIEGAKNYLEVSTCNCSEFFLPLCFFFFLVYLNNNKKRKRTRKRQIQIYCDYLKRPLKV